VVEEGLRAHGHRLSPWPVAEGGDLRAEAAELELETVAGRRQRAALRLNHGEELGAAAV
jgi:hypothetical protein